LFELIEWKKILFTNIEIRVCDLKKSKGTWFQ